MQEKPTLISKTFATKMLQLFELEGCKQEDENKFDMKLIADRIEDGTFPVALFNQIISDDCNFEVYSRNHVID